MTTEGSEYLAQYFAWWMLPAFFAYGLGAWLLWRQVRPVYLPRPAAALAAAFFLFASIGYPARSRGNICRSPRQSTPRCSTETT